MYNQKARSNKRNYSNYKVKPFIFIIIRPNYSFISCYKINGELGDIT